MLRTRLSRPWRRLRSGRVLVRSIERFVEPVGDEFDDALARDRTVPVKRPSRSRIAPGSTASAASADTIRSQRLGVGRAGAAHTVDPDLPDALDVTTTV